MEQCACKVRIEQLRSTMEYAYDNYKSFTDPNVLAASQDLDDALVKYRRCPFFEFCNSSCSAMICDHSQDYITVKRLAV